MRNMLRTAVTLADRDLLTLDDLPGEVVSAGANAPAQSREGKSPLMKMERNTILAALKETHWNVTKAARQLNVSRNTLYRKMKRHGITPPR